MTKPAGQCGWKRFAAVGLAMLLVSAGALARDATEQALDKFRRMLQADPWANPALLDADRGATLWKTPRGPKAATLEACDLGLGPGVVDGAFAALPRYFADADRVMDLETRIVWCMERLQGFARVELTRDPHPASGQPVGDTGAIATWIVTRSSGLALAPPQQHPKEVDAVRLGDALFHRRQGPMDFSCATCHSEPAKRIRLQPLPVLSDPAEARKVIGEWPAYRVSASHVMTMQHRLVDCFWQMRLHKLELGSEASVALIAYLNDRARGGTIAAPSIKR